MIRFHFTKSFTLKNKRKIKNWLKEIVVSEKKKVGDINYIFCSKEYLKKMNNDYLSKNYETDVISFDFTDDNKISGDIYISSETVKKNSIIFNVSFNNELKRVIVHGLLHLLNYNDKSKQEQKIMREKENFYINLNN
ncbi:rRNA maturation RNase YbeY [Bacteroidota bacterium]|nr:rRNA maturation RNase YbeY [Bacteroidota bacterium]MDC3114828.1 rRNA maturation RNase YbeY [Bacteroidota bacterium]